MQRQAYMRPDPPAMHYPHPHPAGYLPRLPETMYNTNYPRSHLYTPTPKMKPVPRRRDRLIRPKHIQKIILQRNKHIKNLITHKR